jgi:WD40 repeat protein
LIRLSDGTAVNTMTGHTDVVYKLRFSMNSDRLFSGSHDGTVRIWDIQGNLLKVMPAGGEVLGTGISSDGTLLATIPFDGPVQLWDANTGEKLSALGGAGGYETSDAVFSPDGKYLAADVGSGLYLWRISDGKSLWEKPINSLAVRFSPDGKYLAYSDTDQHDQVVLSSPDGRQVIRTLEGPPSPMWDLFFSPDSSLLAGNDATQIRIWRVEDGKLLYVGKTSCP